MSVTADKLNFLHLPIVGGIGTDRDFSGQSRTAKSVSRLRRNVKRRQQKFGRLYRTLHPAVQDASGQTGQTERRVSYAFSDVNGNIVKTIDTEGLEVVNSFDLLNRLSASTRSNHQTSETQHYQYFADGQVASTYTLHGNSAIPFDASSSLYDAAGNLIRQTDSLGNNVHYGRNGLGYITSVTDKAGQVTQFDVDALGRILAETLDEILVDNNGTPTTVQLPPRVWDYDAFGNLERYTNRNGQVISYENDDVGNRIQENWIGGDYVANFDYNPLGQLLSASDEITSFGVTFTNSSYVNSYQADSSLAATTRFLNPAIVIDGSQFTESHFAQQFRSEYRFDTRGSATSSRLSVFNGVNFQALFTNAYVFDNLGRATGAQQTIGSDVKSVNLGYDGGQLKWLDRYQNSNLVGESQYQYFADGRLDMLAHAAGSSVDSLSLQYDAQGRVTVADWYNEPGVPEPFDYESIGQTLDDAQNYGRSNASPFSEINEVDQEGNVREFHRFVEPLVQSVDVTTGGSPDDEFSYVNLETPVQAGKYRFRIRNIAFSEGSQHVATIRLKTFADVPISDAIPVNFSDEYWEFDLDLETVPAENQILEIIHQTSPYLEADDVKLEIRALEEFDIDWDYQNRVKSIVKKTYPASDNGNDSTSYSIRT